MESCRMAQRKGHSHRRTTRCLRVQRAEGVVNYRFSIFIVSLRCWTPAILYTMCSSSTSLERGWRRWETRSQRVDYVCVFFPSLFVPGALARPLRPRRRRPHHSTSAGHTSTRSRPPSARLRSPRRARTRSRTTSISRPLLARRQLPATRRHVQKPLYGSNYDSHRGHSLHDGNGATATVVNEERTGACRLERLLRVVHRVAQVSHLFIPRVWSRALRGQADGETRRGGVGQNVFVEVMIWSGHGGRQQLTPIRRTAAIKL